MPKQPKLNTWAMQAASNLMAARRCQNRFLNHERYKGWLTMSSFLGSTRLLSSSEYTECSQKVGIEINPSSSLWIKSCFDSSSSSQINKISFYNANETVLEEFLKKIIEISNPDVCFSTRTTITSWEYKEQKVTQVVQEIYNQFVRRAELPLQKIAATKQELEQHPKMFLIFSSNTPINYHPKIEGFPLFSYFQNLMDRSAPHLKNPQEVQWRYEETGSFTQSDLDFVCSECTKKGFLVEFSLPYFIIEEMNLESDGVYRCRQSINLSIPRSTSLATDATHELHNSYKENFSLHNLLVTCRDHTQKKRTFNELILQRKYTEPTNTIVTYIKRLNEQLTFIAKHKPVIKRFAFEIALLTISEQQELLQLVEREGYSASIDAPFIIERFIGFAEELTASPHFMQYLLIDLP